MTVLNFAITSEGLTEQLLSLVVAAEKHELEEHREKLIFTSAANQSKLRDIEDKILKVLSTSQGSILDEDEAITVLTTSKTISNEIEEKQRIADKAEKENAASRALYRPVASHATILYSVIADLADLGKSSACAQLHGNDLTDYSHVFSFFRSHVPVLAELVQ